jgi:hypothetical protein
MSYIVKQQIEESVDRVTVGLNTKKIEIGAEEDAALAVVDGDSLWREKNTKQEIHWKGRICKIYARMAAADWKLIFQTGLLDYELCRDS